MVLIPEFDESRFDSSLIVNFLENKAIPQLPVTCLVQYGSSTTDGFDAKGDGTSDIDCIAVTSCHFDKLELPGWEIPRQAPGIAHARGLIDGRKIHLFVSSEQDLAETLNLLVNAVENNDIMLLVHAWSYVKRITEGQVVHGNLPEHPFYGLLETSEKFQVLNTIFPFISP